MLVHRILPPIPQEALHDEKNVCEETITVVNMSSSGEAEMCRGTVWWFGPRDRAVTGRRKGCYMEPTATATLVQHIRPAS